MRHRRWKCSSSTSLCRLWSLEQGTSLWLTCCLPCLSWEAARPIDFVFILDPSPGVSTAGPWKRWLAFSPGECHHGNGRHRRVEKLKLVPINTYGFLLTFIGSSLPCFSHHPSFFLLQMQNQWHHPDFSTSSYSWDSHVPMMNPLWYLSRSSTPLIESDRYIISRECLIEKKVKKPRRTFPFPFTFNIPLPTLFWLTQYIFCPWTFAICNNVFGLPWSLSCPFPFMLSYFFFYPAFHSLGFRTLLLVLQSSDTE